MTIIVVINILKKKYNKLYMTKKISSFIIGYIVAMCIIYYIKDNIVIINLN